MRHLISFALLVAGAIHLLPLAGVLGPEKLSALYGIPVAEPNLTILLRHRAVLFGLLGGLMVAAAFRPDLQPVAFVLGGVSAASFLWVAWSTGGYNGQLARVVWADGVALVCLGVGGLAKIAHARSMRLPGPF